MSRLKLLTFDVTNTLLRVKASPAHQYAEAAKVFGIEFPEDKLQNVYRSTWKKKKQDHPNYGLALGMTSKEWWHDFVVRVFLNAGFGGNPSILRNVSDYLWDQFERGACWEVLPKSHSVLSRFKNSGLKLGIVSNFDERLEKTLVFHDLAKYFDFLVASVMVNAEKPNPVIFQHALKLGKTEAGNAGHVGDDVFNDYFAARNVGMQAFLLQGDQELPSDILKLVERKNIIQDLTELESLVLKE